MTAYLLLNQIRRLFATATQLTCSDAGEHYERRAVPCRAVLLHPYAVPCCAVSIQRHVLTCTAACCCCFWCSVACVCCCRSSQPKDMPLANTQYHINELLLSLAQAYRYVD